MNVPARPLRMPHPRHRLARVRQRTRAKRENTVIESWVDVRADIEAINRGEGTRRGDVYEINGRRYRLDADGHTSPISGPGLHPLSRPAFRALGVYNTFGSSAMAEEILDQMGVPERERLAGRTAWHVEQTR